MVIQTNNIDDIGLIRTRICFLLHRTPGTLSLELIQLLTSVKDSVILKDTVLRIW